MHPMSSSWHEIGCAKKNKSWRQFWKPQLKGRVLVIRWVKIRGIIGIMSLPPTWRVRTQNRCVLAENDINRPIYITRPRQSSVRFCNVAGEWLVANILSVINQKCCWHPNTITQISMHSLNLQAQFLSLNVTRCSRSSSPLEHADTVHLREISTNRRRMGKAENE